MKSLATLIKLQKNFVDEQRQLIATLQRNLDRIVQAIAELEVEKIREQVAAQENPEILQTYGAFLKAAVERGREFEKQRLAAEQAIEAAREKLAILFEEQKRYEIAEAARLEAKLKEEIRQERIELDEIGGVSFQRNKE